MLENSVWRKYNPELKVQDALAKIYKLDLDEVEADEVEVYSELKRKLTKKELKQFAMQSALCSEEDMMNILKLSAEELESSARRVNRKVRLDYIQNSIKK
ncbi:MAG: hypothetical protein GQ570_11560 [Helicobacteraceae bacterium]|nr:hypothetical protein [Helicobacteraceae bacterium]